MASSASPRERSIALVGMMGSGKSTIGRLLAARLALPFIDLDEEIEREAGLRIGEIFDRLGEPGFREIERRVTAQMLGGPPFVMATGGGLFADAAARALIQAHCLTIWLDAPHDLLLRRIKEGGRRPMLDGDASARLARLMEERKPAYSMADLRVEIYEEPAEFTADQVARAIETLSAPT